MVLRSPFPQHTTTTQCFRSVEPNVRESANNLKCSAFCWDSYLCCIVFFGTCNEVKKFMKRGCSSQFFSFLELMNLYRLPKHFNIFFLSFVQLFYSIKIVMVCFYQLFIAVYSLFGVINELYEGLCFVHFYNLFK